MKKYKSEKIEEVVQQHDRKLNLHEIKAQTGAGNGYKHPDDTKETLPINDTFVNTNKFHKIHKIVTNIEGKINLHKIKEQTGAGDGFIDQKDLKDNVNTPPCDCSDPKHHYDDTHKSHKIHAVLHASDRRLNLHEIKQKTGAGSGYKN